VTRPSDPWEYSDGAIYLVRELCSSAPLKASRFLPALADVASLTHFPQADTLRETLWKALPGMAAALGKQLFKQHLNELLGPLFDTLSRPTTQQLAGQCYCSGNISSIRCDAACVYLDNKSSCSVHSASNYVAVVALVEIVVDANEVLDY
jgi:hypothetical protein